MKIATFNINNVNRRLPNLLQWLEESAPDVVCLQELKATDASFPAAVIRDAGYAAVWRGQRNWNGVAILAQTAGGGMNDEFGRGSRFSGIVPAGPRGSRSRRRPWRRPPRFSDRIAAPF